jgi:predicted secreted acid phosphatase
MAATRFDVWPNFAAVTFRAAAFMLLALALTITSRPALAAGWDCTQRDKHTLDPTQPLNIGQLKFQLRDYYYCGGYEADFAAVAAEAKKHLEQRANQVKNPAIVLDIDETSLSNWVEIERDDFGFIPGGTCAPNEPGKPINACGDYDWEISAQATALKPTLALYEFARTNGVEVFFITGRREGADLRFATERNLEKQGYTVWNKLMMRPADSHGSPSVFKTAARAEVAKDFTIILNLGDQQSDLDGGNADKAFKLPNPFYYIP